MIFIFVWVVLQALIHVYVIWRLILFMLFPRYCYNLLFRNSITLFDFHNIKNIKQGALKVLKINTYFMARIYLYQQ